VVEDDYLNKSLKRDLIKKLLLPYFKNVKNIPDNQINAIDFFNLINNRIQQLFYETIDLKNIFRAKANNKSKNKSSIL